MPEALAGGDAESLARFFHAHRDEVLARWERRVRALPSARGLPMVALRNHVPVILERVERHIAAATTTSRDEVTAPAEAHAAQRGAQGFDPEEMYREIAVLRDVMIEVRADAGALTAADVVRIVRAFDPVVEAVVLQNQ